MRTYTILITWILMNRPKHDLYCVKNSILQTFKTKCRNQKENKNEHSNNKQMAWLVTYFNILKL